MIIPRAPPHERFSLSPQRYRPAASDLKMELRHCDWHHQLITGMSVSPQLVGKLPDDDVDKAVSIMSTALHSHSWGNMQSFLPTVRLCAALKLLAI